MEEADFGHMTWSCAYTQVLGSCGAETKYDTSMQHTVHAGDMLTGVLSHTETQESGK